MTYALVRLVARELRANLEASRDLAATTVERTARAIGDQLQPVRAADILPEPTEELPMGPREWFNAPPFDENGNPLIDPTDQDWPDPPPIDPRHRAALVDDVESVLGDDRRTP